MNQITYENKEAGLLGVCAARLVAEIGGTQKDLIGGIMGGL